MTAGVGLVRRTDLVIRANPRRVISKLFLPGQETSSAGVSRADAVIQRVLAMTDAEVATTLAGVLRRFDGRHPDLGGVLAGHFALVEHRVPAREERISADRCDLIGAYFTQEYSVEAAALFNPSIVAHPEQGGLAPGELRFVMSVRAVGEGHISSVGFRTGVLGAGTVRLDAPGRFLVTGRRAPVTMSRELVRAALAERSDAATAGHLLGLLPERFTAEQLDGAFASVARDRLTRGSTDAILDRIRSFASSHYRLDFPPKRPLPERVIFPSSPAESHGIEDARFTRFTESDGKARYYATYTAYDGVRMAPHLLQTDDFETFEVSPLIGPAARDKGMAIFPRRVGGRYLALSRWDRESIGIANSTDARNWSAAVTIAVPERPWGLIQLGNGGPPLLTDRGWLVLTHGVGPMRQYGIGAMLLDLHEPTRVLGVLAEPLLTATEAERDGYVPNVVYSCGALIHAGTLVLPYGCSDSAIRIAFVDLERLLARLGG